MKSDPIGGARVLGKRLGSRNPAAGGGVGNNVLQHRAETDGTPDLRLPLGRQANAFGVAAAFEIKYAAAGPAMFVVADEAAFGIRGERGLARTREPEEQRHASIRAYVGGTMHGKYATRRQKVIQDSEDGLLHLARILGARDEDGAFLEIDGDAGFRARSVFLRTGVKRGGEEDREIRVNAPRSSADRDG